LASVTADRVRVRVGLSATDIADNEVATFIDKAVAYLTNQTGLTLDPNSKTDALVRVEGIKYVVEFKSIRRLPEQPLKHHVEQLQFYLAALNCQNGFLTYLEKSALKYSIFPVKFEQAMFKALIDSVQRLNKALMDEEKPESDAQPWECRFCEFKGECEENARDSGKFTSSLCPLSSPNQNVGGLSLCFSVCQSMGCGALILFEDVVSFRLSQLKSLFLDAQKLRRELMLSLQELFQTVSEWAEKDPKAVGIAGYIAQVLNSWREAMRKGSLTMT